MANETTSNELNPQESTPPEGEQTGATPPEADNTGLTQPDADKDGQTYDPDAVEKIVKKRLDRERKKWDQEREAAEERARMSEADKLKADLAQKDEEIATARAEAQTARRLADLTGKVRDPKAAIRLLDDDHVTEDGTVNIDALLEAYPFLAPEAGRPSARSATAPAPASGAPAKNPWAKDTLNLTEQARLLRENPTLAAQLKSAVD